jgi:DeoR family transcriptional regulator of aga operon
MNTIDGWGRHFDPAALEALNVVVMDRVFIGVCGVDPERGATTIEADEAAVFRAMTRRAK